MTPINPFLNPLIQKWDLYQLFPPEFVVSPDSLMKLPEKSTKSGKELETPRSGGKI